MKGRKTRWLSLALSLCMLLSLLPVSALASDGNCTGNHDGWTELNGSMELESLTGNCVLTGDVTVTGTSKGNIEIKSAVTLCLNGHTLNLNGSNSFRIYEHGSLTLCDCQGGGKITNSQSTAVPGIYMEGGSFTMNGGTITGNSGGVEVYKDASFIMNGGSITGNNLKVTKDSHYAPCGGVLVVGGSFTMTGGSITGNTVNAEGGLSVSGGVLVCNDGSFTMTGGEITNNHCTVEGFLPTSGIAGGVCVGSAFMGTGTFTVSGDVTIAGNTFNGSAKNVWLYNSQKISIGSEGLTGGEIGVTRDTPDVFTTGGGANYQQYFFSDDDTYVVVKSGNELTLGTVIDNPHTHHVCGDDICADSHTQATYTPKSDFGGALSAGNYYLSRSVTATGDITITSAVNLCLNGRTLDLGGYQIIVESGGSLTLCDCGSGGQITGGAAQQGGAVLVEGGRLILHSGAITGNTASGGGDGSSGSNRAGGGAVYVNGGSFTMTGGAIENNTANVTEKNDGGGGVLLNGGSFTMSGGSITDNNVTGNDNSVGGGVHVNGGTFTMANGTISNNSAINGGGVTVFKGTDGGSSFTLSGGSITGNSASGTGGGIYVLPGTTFQLSGAPAISGNTAGGAASNIYLNGSVITLTNSLSNTTLYGVSMQTPGLFTSGGGAAYIEKFTSENSGYKVTAKNGELYLSSGYTVSFNLNGGSFPNEAPANQEVEEGGTAANPGNPVRDGHAFAGWYNGGTLWNFNDTVTDNMTLTAKWIAFPTVTVTGNTSLTYGTGGTLTADVTKEAGHTYTYQWYSNTTDSSTGGTIIDGAVNESYSVPNTTNKGTYYYYCTVTASIPGSSVTAAGTNDAVTVTVSAKDYESGSFTIDDIADQIYTGKQITPDVTVKFDGKTLTKGTDYDLEYGTNTAAGTNTGSVTINFKGNYFGSTTVNFDIVYAPLPGSTDLDDYVTIPEPNENGWYRGDITLTPDEGVTIGTKDAATGGVTMDAEGEHTREVFIQDSQGNIYKTEFSYKLDKTAPQVSEVNAPEEDAPWTKDDVTVSFTASDGPSGIASVTVSKDGGTAQTLTGSGENYTFTADSNGTYTVTVTDKAGNTTKREITISNIDKTQPTLDVSGGMEGGGELTLTVSASNPGGSGVKSVTVQKNNGEITDITNSSEYKITEPGTYTFTATTGTGVPTTVTRTVHSITFNSDGGSEVARQLVVSGGKATKPTDPTRTGYAFDCWQSSGADWNFESGEVTTDITLTAKWTLNAPTVSLSASDDNVTYGEEITLTAAASHAAGSNIGFTYEWYKGGVKLSNTESTLTIKNVNESGSYRVVVTATDSANLTATAEDTLTVAIGKATPTLTVADVAITYGDELADSLLHGTASSSGETVSGSFAWGSDKPGTNPAVAQSGNYTVVFTPNDKANYTDATTTVTLTVDRKELTPTVASANDKVYDGNTSTTGTIDLSGAVLGENPTASGEFTFVDAAAGTGKTVNVTVTLHGTWGNNYQLSTDKLTTTANITPKTVGLTWNGYEDLVYDGQPVSVAAEATGLIGNDTCAVIVENGDQINAGTYTARATGLSNPNYQLPTTGTTQDYTIVPRPVKLSWDEDSFTYDGSAKTVTATVTNAAAQSDSFNLTYTGRIETAAGSYTAEVTALGNPNYTLDGGSGVSLDWTIDQAVISFEVANNSYTYDNTAKTASVTQTENEPTKIDAGKYTVTYGGENSQTAAGTYDITVTISDPNFCFAGGAVSAKVGELIIARKQAVVTWQNLTQVYGDYQPVTVLIDGLAAGDSADQAVISGAGTAAGRYPLSVMLANYQLSNNTATLVIQQKPVVVTVTDNAAPAGGEPTINVSSGLVEGEDYTVTYKDRDGNPADITKPGTYEVWVEFENPNYRHPDGSGEKQVGTFTVTSGTPTLYTVTFDGDGATGGSMADLELAGGSILTLPACGCSKSGSSFAGWLYGGKTYKPGDSFTMPYGDVRFEAQWVEERSVPVTVKDESGGVEKAVVSIWQGSNKLDENVTDADGSYTFENLVPGSYNVSVTVGEKTVTTLVTVDEEGAVTGGEVFLPSQDLSSRVEVAPGTPDIVVDGLDGAFTEADKQAAESGKVELTLKAEQKQESGLTEEQAEQLRDNAGGAALGLYVDISLDKVTTPAAGDPTTETGADSEELLTITVPLPTELKDKYSYTVARTDEEEGESLSRTPDKETGEYFELSEDGKSIILHVKESATYAVGYQNAPAPVYPPVKEESDNGSFTVSPGWPIYGQTVTITPKPEAGYTVDKVTVVDQSGNEIKVTPNTDGTYIFTQPSGSVTITVTFKEGATFSDCPRDESCPLAGFDDLNANTWYHDGVHYCVENGLMQGYGNGIFGPNNTLSRAMLVQILYNLENRPAVSGESAFSDVADGAWYADAVNWAAANNIVGGYGNGDYGPNDPITREQFAAILYRYAQYKNYDVSVEEDTNILSYSDASEVSEYAVPAMQWACGAGIVKGHAGALDPTGNATRAQAATMLMRFGAI